LTRLNPYYAGSISDFAQSKRWSRKAPADLCHQRFAALRGDRAEHLGF
jgi:hypothetical protein